MVSPPLTFDAPTLDAHVRAYRLDTGARRIVARTRATIEASRRLLEAPVVPLQSIPPNPDADSGGAPPRATWRP